MGGFCRKLQVLTLAKPRLEVDFECPCIFSLYNERGGVKISYVIAGYWVGG